MFAIFASFLMHVGSWFANFGCTACPSWWIEEPQCPKSLIK